MASQNDMPSKLPINRNNFENLVKRRFFYAASFAIYGGSKGLYDFGPPGCAMKANLLNFWRQHFILEDNLLEIDGTCLTPEVVLKTSGHVEKFEDLMVKDVKTFECFRADHLLEDKMDELIEAIKEPKKTNKKNSSSSSSSSSAAVVISADDQKLIDTYQKIKNQADDLSIEDLGKLLKEYKITSPETGNELTDPFPFNLMFKTHIGPTGKLIGYLRPETAQGIFMNFSRLLEQNGGRMPFGGATIGRAFRNEIAPRAGLLRVREFSLAEIEFFVDPNDKNHKKFDQVSSTVVNIFPRDRQLKADNSYYPITIKDAVEQGLIANQTLGYYIARCQQYLIACGAKKECLRFRQHLENEMAHYACDCWDAELLTSYGWIECVGNADRSCYDLSVHQKATNTRQTYYKTYNEPITKKQIQIQPNKGLVGKTFRKDARFVFQYFAELQQKEEKLSEFFNAFQKLSDSESIEIVANDQKFSIAKNMLKIAEKDVKISGEEILPSVIEPSYGIGRILYALLEQSFYSRAKDEQRGVLALSPFVAPVKVSILPLFSKQEFLDEIPAIQQAFTRHNISSKVDDSSVAIGKKYARTDEIGIPFGVTIDHTTFEDRTVTLRERDSMKQVRIKIDQLPQTLNDLIAGRKTWSDVTKELDSK